MRADAFKSLLPLSLAVLAAACGGGSPSGTADAGEAAFALCLACHAPDAQHRPTGPNLHDLIGRPAASQDGYFFSEALKTSGIVWTAETLDAFIANPSTLVPGTFMTAGVPDPERRKAIVAHLQTLGSGATAP